LSYLLSHNAITLRSSIIANKVIHNFSCGADAPALQLIHMDNISFFKRLASSRSHPQEDADYKIDLVKAGVPMPEAAEDEGPVGQLTVDIYHTPQDIVVRSAIAGARPEDIDVVVASDSISIKGLRQREPEADNAEYLHQECYWANSPARSSFRKKWIRKTPVLTSRTESFPSACPRPTAVRRKSSKCGWIDPAHY